MKVKYTAMVAGISGSISGTTFGKNRGGDYMRTKVTPLNKRSTAQQSVRSSLQFYSQQWRALTVNQRNGWMAIAEQFKRTNVFGDIKNPTGFNVYVKLNQNLTLQGYGGINNPPALVPFDLGLSISAIADVSDTSFDITFAPDPAPSEQTVIISATPMLSAGVKSFSSKYVFIAAAAPEAISPLDIYNQYVGRFGNLIAGARVALKGELMNTVTGQKSVPVFSEVVVTA